MRGDVLLDTGATPSVPIEVLASFVQYGLTPKDAASVTVVGTPTHAAERFSEYQNAGADHPVLGVIGDNWKHQHDLIAEAHALLDRS